MPKIVRAGGLIISDDVVKIRDIAPGGARPAKRPRPAVADEGELPLPDEDGLDAALADAEAEAAMDEAPHEHRAPPPADDAVREEVIQSAMAEAGRILEDAVRKAEAARQAALDDAAAELEALRRQAAEAGRADAREAVLGEVKQLAGELEGAVARYEGERAGFEAEHEAQLRWLAVEIAGKVLAKKVADDDAEMAEMVDKAVQSVRSEPWIRVEVSREMTRLIDALTRLYDQETGIEVSAVPAEPGTVHIETPSGVVDASLRTQLENLRGYFAQTPPA